MKPAPIRLLLWIFFATCLYSQIGLSPPVATVGAPGATLQAGFSNVDTNAFGTNLVVRFNGMDRPTRFNLPVPNSIALSFDLTASDLAHCGLAEITAHSPDKHLTLPSSLYLPIGLPVNPTDIIYDSQRNKIYASINSAAATTRFAAGSIITIDPETCSVGPALQVGHEPNRLAISGDFQSLYVGLDATSSILRIDLNEFVAGPQFSLKSTTLSGMLRAGDIAVMPGKANTLAVGMIDNIVQAVGVAIFDDGVERPNESFQNAWAGATLLFNSAGTNLIAGPPYDINCGYGPVRFSVDAMGLSDPIKYPNGTGAPLGLANGLLYTTGGLVFDATAAVAVGDLHAIGPGYIDTAMNRAVVLRNPMYTDRLEQELIAFDLPTDLPLGHLAIPTPQYFPSGHPESRLLRWGTDGVAFRSNGSLLSLHTPIAGPPPSATNAGVVNAASFIAGSISPGEILTIFGSNLGPSLGRSFDLNAPNQVAAQLGSVQVWFDTLPGIVLFANPNQVNVIAPFELSGRTLTHLQVWNFGIPSQRIPLQIQSATPGIFTQAGSGKGAGAILNQDFSLNSASHPAARGSAVSVFATGFGKPSAPVIDGRIVLGPDTLVTLPVTATIGGRQAQVLFAGSAPQLLAGVFQINLLVPPDAPAGASVPVVISVSGSPTQTGVTVAIQ